jgi:predicted lysophospholipase L1 biosynthesis ABC-type transport system permease subunit
MIIIKVNNRILVSSVVVMIMANINCSIYNWPLNQKLLSMPYSVRMIMLFALVIVSNVGVEIVMVIGYNAIWPTLHSSVHYVVSR